MEKDHEIQLNYPQCGNNHPTQIITYMLDIQQKVLHFKRMPTYNYKKLIGPGVLKRYSNLPIQP